MKRVLLVLPPAAIKCSVILSSPNEASSCFQSKHPDYSQQMAKQTRLLLNSEETEISNKFVYHVATSQKFQTKMNKDASKSDSNFLSRLHVNWGFFLYPSPPGMILKLFQGVSSCHFQKLSNPNTVQLRVIVCLYRSCRLFWDATFDHFSFINWSQTSGMQVSGLRGFPHRLFHPLWLSNSSAAHSDPLADRQTM